MVSPDYSSNQQWNTIFKKEGVVFTKPQKDIPKISVLFRQQCVKRILDLGCGSGRHTVYFAKKGFDVYGIDIARQGLRITKLWLRKEGLKADLKCGSVYDKLPYPDKFFDALISIQVINHARIETIRKAIGEIERILKPKGIIFITVAKTHRGRFHTRKSKLIAPRTCIPLEGKEKGLIHHLFTKDALKKEFRNFLIHGIWEASTAHYCLLGELRSGHI
ncbi:MAG: class I SAM-dependent methyltransferase [Planctomycetota bacterium]